MKHFIFVTALLPALLSCEGNTYDIPEKKENRKDSFGSTYYMYYTSAEHVYVATAKSPVGPWTKCAYNPILQKPGSLVGTGHCAVFTDLKGQMKMIFHAHPSTSAYSPRQTYITDISFENVGGEECLVASPNYKTLYLYGD